MRTKVESVKLQVLEELLGETRAESDKLLRRVRKLEKVLMSTRAIMGHELKKPATAIAGYLDLAIDELSDLGNEDLTTNLTKARRECVLLNELNTFFLELLRMNVKEEARFGGSINLRRFVNEVVGHCPVELDAGSRVTVRFGRASQNFCINPNAFKIILSNVVENALYYSPSDSSVSVHIETAPDKRGLAKRSLLKIRVTDQGPGIPKTHMKKIFDPFVRLHDEPQQGSGLGLTLVRSLVELYDGHVSLLDNKPTGCSVLLTIPELVKEQEEQT